MNLDALLAPVSEASPCGDDLSFSAEFDAIRELRRADDPTLDQGAWVTSLKSADWPAVAAQCESIFIERSKDLQVAAWLTDAHARLAGYAGMADGLTLCASLCDRYWDDVHPRLEQGDAEQRGGNLRWLLTQVEWLGPQMVVLRLGPRAISLRDVEAVARAGERDAAAGPATGEAALTPEDIVAARRGTPRPFLASNATEARRSVEALAHLQQVIDARMPDDGPSFVGARRSLEDALHAVERLARDLNAVAPSVAGVEQGQSGSAAGSTVMAASHGVGPLLTRADALQQLRAVAEFFRRTEPHSPVAYLADRAAKWGEMPLHDWLRAVLKDQGTLASMEELLGLETDRKAAE